MAARVLIVSYEAPGVHMAGPAIRYWHLAHALAAELPVTLAVPAPVPLSSSSVNVVGYDRSQAAELHTYVAAADVLICAGFSLYHYPFLRTLPQPMVIDLYAPFVLEILEMHAARPAAEQAGIQRVTLGVLNEQLGRGDFFLCASEPQRDFWLGMLMANGRVNPYTLNADRTLRRLIEVVPFGIPETAPVHQRRVLKGVYPGIGEADKVIYWGGGLWEWFDPLTAIRAVAQLAARRTDVKLFFAGVQHPNPTVPQAHMVEAARQLSQELGLTDKHVFFNEWVPYAERANYLLEADVGLSLHFENLETHLAYRTRLLDYIWAGLPLVGTRGDVLGELAAARGLARTVAPEDVTGVAEALEAMLNEPDRAVFVERARAVVEELRWSRVVGPLLDFCRQPLPAADRLPTQRYSGLTPDLLKRAWGSLRTRGLGGLVRDARLYLNLP
jgi:glycosyltransferase involved in cell wall biosynthesis